MLPFIEMGEDMSHNSGVKLKVPSSMLTLRCFVDI